MSGEHSDLMAWGEEQAVWWVVSHRPIVTEPGVMDGLGPKTLEETLGVVHCGAQGTVTRLQLHGLYA